MDERFVGYFTKQDIRWQDESNGFRITKFHLED